MFFILEILFAILEIAFVGGLLYIAFLTMRLVIRLLRKALNKTKE